MSKLFAVRPLPQPQCVRCGTPSPAQYSLISYDEEGNMEGPAELLCRDHMLESTHHLRADGYREANKAL